MPNIRMTYDLARAVARDSLNRRLKAEGRTKWTQGWNRPHWFTEPRAIKERKVRA